MRNHHLKFHHVSFSYDSTSTPLLQDVTFHLASGWTGVIGANGAGKTTLLRLATGLSQPEEGVIDIPPRTLYVPQRTDDPPEQLCQLLADPEKEAILVKDRLKLQPDWGKRWETLSHGERKRAQMAVALWENPEVLAIDEPTNHIDAEAREIIAAALYHFKGIGLLVSHDRALLDRLCHQCLFVEPPGIILRLGGVTKGFEIQKAEQAAIQKEQGQRKRAYQVLRREMLRRREIANQKRSKRGIAARDHDAKEKIDRARVSGKDAIGGKLLRQLQGRLTRTAQQVAELHVKKKYRLGISLPSLRSERDTLLRLAGGILCLGESKWLDYPEIVISPSDRIALTGSNGTGKSTLVRSLVAALSIPRQHLTYLPQEIGVTHSQQILREVRALPHEQLGQLMTVISRLGSRPERLLETQLPSPGEIRKLLLALGITYNPQIIIMDEPTNHLDLPSIECLEEALQMVACCLILVSHDQQFLSKLARIQWTISRDQNLKGRYVMQIL